GGSTNSDDQGTGVDLRAEVYRNGTLVASGTSYCVSGVTRDPAAAKRVTIPFGPPSAATFNGAAHLLSLQVLAPRHHGGRRVLWRPQLRRPSRVLRRQEPGLRAQRDLSAVGIRMASGARLMAGMTVGHPRHSADAVRRPGARVLPGRAQPNR